LFVPEGLVREGLEGVGELATGILDQGELFLGGAASS
jgi:hypothetical protein